METIVAFEVREDEYSSFEELKNELGIKLVCHPFDISLKTLDQLEGTQAISILGHSHLDAELLQALHDAGVRYISTRTVGYNHIDLQAAQQLGIRVSNAFYDPHGVADYTVMLILMLLRKYKQAMWRANVNDYSLRGLQGRELRKLTVGIVGTGSIGAQLAHNLTGFGCRIIAHSRRENPELAGLVEYLPLDELYAQADIISYHVPVTAATLRMVNKNSLAKMKDGVILINSSRGELMQISDVIDAIESHKIGALAMDVFENESGIYHQDRRTDIISNRDMAYVRQFPNVIMTQHIAFYTDTAVENMVRCGIESLLDFIKTGQSDREIFPQ